MKPFDDMKVSSLFFRIVEKNFPTHEVSAIGLKLAGLAGSSSALLFGIRVIEALFHAVGISWVCQQWL